tara:strand:+ start:133 stop:498 length:366 start_codon:yes stop_codon:yes gene_type:complete
MSSRERGAIDLDWPGVPGVPIVIVRVDQVSEVARLEPATQEGEEAVEGRYGKVLQWEVEATSPVVLRPLQKEFRVILEHAAVHILRKQASGPGLLSDVAPVVYHEAGAGEERRQVFCNALT